MSTQLTGFLFAVLLGAISTLIGYALYRFGSAHIKYKSATFGGAVAIAGMAFVLMSQFYFRHIEVRSQERHDLELKLTEAIVEYDTCVVQEAGGKSCRVQASALRDACAAVSR